MAAASDALSGIATLVAGVPALNNALYHRIRFLVGDPAALVETPLAEGGRRATLILRDIEMDRARRKARADAVACPADFTPPQGLSGDRETATAQAVAELLRRAGQRRVIADRSLPLLFAHVLGEAGIEVICDPERGVLERRTKDEQEINWLQEAQHMTEQAMQMACELVARAEVRSGGVLWHDGAALTSERVKRAIDVFLLERNYANPESIVAGGPQGADCHDHGHGELRTGEPILIDVFPRNRATLYYGDCTRTVVHGEIPPLVAHMHRAVVQAKAAATQAVRPGVTGEQVHAATTAAMLQAGYRMGLPKADDPPEYCAMVHGTGHGVGLDVHEPPLLDRGGPPLVMGDCLTIEPGLYTRALGGVRVEDMVIVTPDGCRNLNRLPEGLAWR